MDDSYEHSINGPFLIRDGRLKLIFERDHEADPELRDERRLERDIAALPVDLAIAFDDDGVLLKAGLAKDVAEWNQKVLPGTSLTVEEVLNPSIVCFPANEATVEELNNCVHITGYVLKLEDRLRELASGIDSGMVP